MQSMPVSAAATLPRSTPEAQGISSQAIIDFLDAAHEQGAGQEFHSLMIVRHGTVVAEGWWKPYGPDRRHLLYSLSKSFTSSAIGIAIGEGKLSLDDSVISFFPDKAPDQVSDNLGAMRVRHLLSMSAGQRSEPWPNLDGRNYSDWTSAFLNHAVEDEPGSKFLYNSIATFMLSAILRKVTGESLLDYLRPRLLDPLGIDEALWDVNPDGIEVGGWGMSITTESIAKFGLLYLDDGMWHGKRLLPEGWVATATRSHIDNGPNENADWGGGYGFQFWRCQHDSYRADGAYGQLCVVIDQADMVVAITARVEMIHLALELIWTHLFPATEPAPLAEDADRSALLLGRLSNLQVRVPAGDAMLPAEAVITGRVYEGDGGFTSMSWRFDATGCDFKFETEGQVHTARAGRKSWIEGSCDYDNGRHQPVAASGAWSSPDTYVICLQYLEEPASTLFEATFERNRVSVTTTRRGRFVDPRGPVFEGASS